MCDGSVAGDYFRNITAGLTGKGVELLLVELGPGKAPTWLADYPKARYVSLNAAGKLQIFAARKKLAALLRDQKIDILHTHLFYSGLIGAFAKKRARQTIFALMRHHTGVVRMSGTRFHVMADKWMAERADHVMTVSEAARRYMHEADGIRRDIDVVYLGFDFEKMSPKVEKRAATRAALGFGDKDLVIGYVGNFANGKGHIQLVRAFEKIAADVPHARLLLGGRGMLAEVEAAIAKFPAGKIVLAGWRDDVAGIYNAMDIFVQPSLSEAFSQVLIEAMGCGLAVVATDVGGASEVIESGVNGILIEPDDSIAIAREVLRFAGDEKMRREIADCGMQSVRNRFPADIMVGKHLELYENWMNEK